MRALQTMIMGALLSACVTINVYFPAAAAERAADRIIEDVWGGTPPPAAPAPAPQGSLETSTPLLVAVLDLLLPAAQAQADIDISSPAIAAIKGRMERRHSQLAPLYAGGAVGLANDSTVAVRDLNVVPLKDRQTVQRLVAEENADRKSLYAEIARANQHPEWEGDIRATFARRWIANARPGWPVQRPDGSWASR